MNRTLLVTALIAGAAFGTSFAASAQTNAATTTGRDVKQEQRIENGLQNGSITTRENAQLQRDEAHVDHLQAKDMKNGSLSPTEKARLTAAQDKTSRDIRAAKTNGIDGNPLSASSQRAQADTQRNINQQTRISNGVKDGSLTNHEAAKLERGQSHVDAREARAGADGHVSAGEQHRIARADNRQSARIHRQRHDAQVKG
ncbi:MAG: hypothetical protein ABIR54_20505 [Burkholderiaceae bacterium]|jgi:hypothetical protein